MTLRVLSSVVVLVVVLVVAGCGGGDRRDRQAAISNGGAASRTSTVPDEPQAPDFDGSDVKCRGYHVMPGDSGVSVMACDERDFAGDGRRLRVVITEHGRQPKNLVRRAPHVVAPVAPMDLPRYRIVAKQDAEVEVFVGWAEPYRAPGKEGVTSANETFRVLHLRKGAELELRASRKGAWTLVDTQGKIVASRRPRFLSAYVNK